MKLKIKKLQDSAKIPSFAYKTDAGFDLFSVEDIEIKNNKIVAVSTGISMEIPKGYVGLIWDKSGLSLKNGIKTMGGVIDSGYRGEVKVILTNLLKKPYLFKKGDKIAQMLIQEIKQPEILEVNELNEADRGDFGFGSTGK